MKELNLSSDNYNWMHYLSPTAKSMIFALPWFEGFSEMFEKSEFTHLE